MADGTNREATGSFVPAVVLDRLREEAKSDATSASMLGLIERIDREQRERTAQWGGRPIRSEQDMVDYYRVINPEAGDEFARLLWQYRKG